MARPIEVTPILKDKYAKQLHREAGKTIVFTKDKKVEIKKCKKLFNTFYSNFQSK